MEHNNIFEQMANISKAGAYDIIVKQRNELLDETAKLKEQNKVLKEALTDMILLHDTAEERNLTEKYKNKVKEAKKLINPQP